MQWLTLYVPWRQRWPLVILPSHVLREESTVTEGSAGTSSMVPYDTIVPWAHAPVGLPGILEFTGQMRGVRSTGVQGPACRAPWLWQPGAAAPTPAPSSSCSPGGSGLTAPPCWRHSRPPHSDPVQRRLRRTAVWFWVLVDVIPRHNESFLGETQGRITPGVSWP